MVDEPHRTTVRKTGVRGILEHQQVVVAALLGQPADAAARGDVRIAERHGRMVVRAGIGIAAGILRRGASIAEHARVGEELAAVDIKFEVVVVPLAVPCLLRSLGGIDQHHHRGVLGPAVADCVVAAVLEALDARRRHLALGALRSEPLELLIVGEQVAVVAHVAQQDVAGPRRGARITEIGGRIIIVIGVGDIPLVINGVIGIDQIFLHLDHLAHGGDVIGRETVGLPVGLGHDHRRTETLDRADMVVQVVVLEPAVGKILLDNLLIEDRRTVGHPLGSLLHLGKEQSRERHGLSLRDAVVRIGPVVVLDKLDLKCKTLDEAGQRGGFEGVGPAVVIHQRTHVLHAGGDTQRHPADVFILGRVVLRIGLRGGMVRPPVVVNAHPRVDVLFVLGHIVGLGLGHEPLVAVELTAELLIAVSVERPVDAVARSVQIGIGTAVAVHERRDLKTVTVLEKGLVGCGELGIADRSD